MVLLSGFQLAEGSAVQAQHAEPHEEGGRVQPGHAAARLLSGALFECGTFDTILHHAPHDKSYAVEPYCIFMWTSAL